MDLHTVEEIVDAGAHGAGGAWAWRPGDAWLAGGTWLFSEPQPHLRRLLDLSRTGWPPLVERPGGELEIAATCTVAELARHPHPLFARCARAFLASFKIWNVATVGGNLCNALPAGPMISLTAALDGTCLLIAPDGTTRTLPVTGFVTGNGTTALRPGELLRSITLPAGVLARPSAFRQASVQQLGRSAVLVIGTRGPGGVELTVTASTPRPVRVPPGASADVGPWFDDVHGDPAWRRHLTLRFADQIRQELA